MDKQRPRFIIDVGARLPAQPTGVPDPDARKRTRNHGKYEREEAGTEWQTKSSISQVALCQAVACSTSMACDGHETEAAAFADIGDESRGRRLYTAHTRHRIGWYSRDRQVHDCAEAGDNSRTSRRPNQIEVLRLRGSKALLLSPAKATEAGSPLRVVMRLAVSKFL